ncbi:alpha/beta hydrolase [Methanobrevibacter sp.]|uniref:alpha/beta fold hydrolase n=1 Tax=Methanobrevibacter sp. TaxID=66852 RepID=UPI0025D58261|nr:alpha/beta hydrolase [Methanobrevibacter sp.]MBQ2962864.1 alpha/beta hydrolase [Methanobrevibacter sp.]
MTKMMINDININYELEGEGKTIVFVHGLSDNLNYWKVLTENLKNDYQTLIFDLRGHGESGDDERKTTIDLYMEDLYLLLKALNIENATFVGLSLGGNVILDLAVNHPEMVNGLIIMSSFPEHTEILERIFDDFRTAINQGFVEFFDTILPYTLTEDMLEEHNEVLEALKYEAAEVANVEGIKKGIEAGYGFNITDKLSEIDVPTVVIAGKEDNLTDLDIQMKISDNIKDAELLVFDKTKHNILIGSNIENVLNIINDFMKKID